jgi:hypothetical protein
MAKINMSILMGVIFFIVVATLAIVLPIVLSSGSSEQRKPGYVPLLAPGRVQTRV